MYADVNSLHLYYEIHGEGTPIVLLHGGVLTIDLNFAGLIPVLAKRHHVIALEAQGHGRTADVARPITPANMATDVVALLDHLGLERAHILGHSMGAATALELAVNHPGRVLSIVPISATVRPDGMHSDFLSPEAMATSTRMPGADDFVAMKSTYERLSPTPDQFDAFLARMSASAADLVGWSDEQLAGVTSPVLLVQGDHDFGTVEHAALMHQLIPGSRLAILPGTTHMQVTSRVAILDLLLRDFLA